MKPSRFYRFRDYWSNRQGYGKNRLKEDKALDFSDIHNTASSEFIVLNDKTKFNSVDVVTAEGKKVASSLVKPSVLVRKYSLRSAKKPMFSHIEKHLPSLAALMVFINFGYGFLYWLQAKSYEKLLEIPSYSQHDLIMLNLSNRVLLACLLLVIMWTALLTLWVSGATRNVITSFGCALGLNLLTLILFIYSGEVPLGPDYNDKPLAIGLLGIIGTVLGLMSIYWLRRQTYTPRALLGHMLIKVRLRIVIPIVLVILCSVTGYLALPDGNYPSLIRSLGLFALFGYVGLTLYMQLNPSLKLYKLTCYLYDDRQEESLTFRKSIDDRPWWVNGQYWVLRYIYSWRWEFTLPRPRLHDFERIELWCNAKTGKLEWIVSDFHYRELWRKVSDNLNEIIVDWDENFHTFDIDVQPELQTIAKRIGEIESKKGLSGIPEIAKLYDTYLEKRQEFLRDFLKIHPPEYLLPYLTECGLATKTVAKELSGRPWTYWRYAFGAYPRKNYSRKKFELWNRYAASGADYPASAHQMHQS